MMAENTTPYGTPVYVDVAGGLARIMNNQAIYRKMLGLFLKSPEFDAFEECLAAKDYTKAAEVAHGIKGMTGNLSLPALFEYSTQLMNSLRSGMLEEQTLASYRDALVKTRAEVEKILAEMGA